LVFSKLGLALNRISILACITTNIVFFKNKLFYLWFYFKIIRLNFKNLTVNVTIVRITTNL